MGSLRHGLNLKNAMVKLEKNGWRPVPHNCGQVWRYVKGPNSEQIIDLYTNPPDETDGSIRVTVIDFRLSHWKDELETDYHAGTFCRSLAHAFRMAERAARGEEDRLERVVAYRQEQAEQAEAARENPVAAYYSETLGKFVTIPE